MMSTWPTGVSTSCVRLQFTVNETEINTDISIQLSF